MRELRKRFTMGLVLLMCTLTGHCSESAPSSTPAAAAGRIVQQDFRRMVEIVKHVEETRGRHSVRTAAPLTTRPRTSPVVPKDLRNLKTENKGDEAVGEWRLVIVGGTLTLDPKRML